MADETDPESKTEDPTPRRREEARKQGQVPFSNELVGAAVTLAGIVGLDAFGRAIGDTMLDVFRTDLPQLFRAELTPSAAQQLIGGAMLTLLLALAPLFALMVAVGVAASAIQAGFQITPERLELKFEKLNPATGFGRLFSLAAVVKGLLAVLKVAAIATVAYLIVEGRAGVIGTLDRNNLGGAVAASWALIIRLGLYLTAAVAVVAALDYVYQRRRFEKGLMMTKEELKREIKQDDGDPQMKHRMRQMSRERMRRQKMLAEVPTATVVVTNPTEYAVALRYVAGRDLAPTVVARGKGALAVRVVAAAREAEVPVLERPPLARALYAGVRDGQAVPQELFAAVAEVIAFLYKLKGITR
jgi:flagellar biosynthetic protein FlhB